MISADEKCNCAVCNPTPELAAIRKKYEDKINTLRMTDFDIISGESALEFLHAHCVWSDGNIEDSDIDFCLSSRGTIEPREDVNVTVLDLVDESLKELRALPRENRGE